MKELVFLLMVLGMTGMVCTLVLGQNQAGPEAQSNLDNLATGQSQVVAIFDGRYAGVRGHPYLFDQWVQGEINFGAENSGLVELKLDVYNQRLFVKQRNSVRELDLGKARWESFVLETDEFAFLFRMVEYWDKKGRTQKELFQIRLEGSWMYLTRHEKDFKKADYKNAYRPPEYQDEFVDRRTDYIFKPDKTIHKYKKPNDLKKILGNQYSMLTDYVKVHDLDLSKNEDLIKSLQFLNTKH